MDSMVELARSGTAGREVVVRAGKRTLAGTLTMPRGARSIVLFGHDGGRGHDGEANAEFGRALGRAGIASLVFDLLTLEEDADDSGELGIHLDVLANRIVGAAEWIKELPEARALRVGLFGARGGAAAALVAAIKKPDVGAVVLRGGRCELAGSALERLAAPTLLMVGGADPPMLHLVRAAQARMSAPNEVLVIPGATHRFDEPGVPETAANAACAWFNGHLGPANGGSNLRAAPRRGTRRK